MFNIIIAHLFENSDQNKITVRSTKPSLITQTFKYIYIYTYIYIAYKKSKHKNL